MSDLTKVDPRVVDIAAAQVWQNREGSKCVVRHITVTVHFGWQHSDSKLNHHHYPSHDFLNEFEKVEG